MNSLSRKSGDRATRLELIGRVQLAYEHLRDTMQRYRDASHLRADLRHRLAGEQPPEGHRLAKRRDIGGGRPQRSPDQRGK